MSKTGHWVVISTCTAKKAVPPVLGAQDLARGPQAQVLDRWLAVLAKARDRHALEKVYAGRAIQLARSAAVSLGTQVNIISAGLGFVRASTRIPSYDLTISAGVENSLTTLVEGPFVPQYWWDGIQQGPYASPLVADDIGRGRVLIALTEPYVKLIARDLVTLAQKNCELRLFGSSLAKRLPAELAPYVLPYDERLSAISSGTKVDFPQRALLDYAQNIAKRVLGLDQDYKAVVQRMAAIADKPTPRPQRTRHSDEEILRIIRATLPVVGRSKTKLLSHLRRRMGIACEQSRFSRLYADI